MKKKKKANTMIVSCFYCEGSGDDDRGQTCDSCKGKKKVTVPDEPQLNTVHRALPGFMTEYGSTPWTGKRVIVVGLDPNTVWVKLTVGGEPKLTFVDRKNWKAEPMGLGQ